MQWKHVRALVTGANGGIGQALVRELLRRGAARVYVGGRDLRTLASLIALDPERVAPLVLDVTKDSEIQAAARAFGDVNILINNAGFCGVSGALSSEAASVARQEMDVNFFGPLQMTSEFAPMLARNGGGSIVNILSFLSLATLPLMGTYSASKAAALALTRSQRAELRAQGTQVIAVMPVQVDTAMGEWTSDAKVTPGQVASDTLDAVESGEEEVFPGELSRQSADEFARDPKGVQIFLSTMLPKHPNPIRT